MEIVFNRGELAACECDWAVLPILEGEGLSEPVQQLDGKLGGWIERLRASGDLTGKADSLVPLRGLSGVAPQRVLLVGIGPRSEVSATRLRKSLLVAMRSLTDKPGMKVAVLLPGLEGIPGWQAVEATVFAAEVAGVGQDLYRNERCRFPLAQLQLLTHDPTAESTVGEARVIAQAVNLARELVNRMPSEITPRGFAERAQACAKQSGLLCEVFDEPRLQAEQMQSLLAVARGSAEPPRLVVLEHRGAGGTSIDLALVGKGVTFDSGGLSLKPTDGMLTMKCDMAGAATVLATMQAIAELRLPVNVIGLMGLVENMPSGSSFKLGDILRARNGVTIEVHNTDAEGRLVLADVLSYAVDRGAKRIIDLATLTGACVVALGEDVAGAMSNNEAWQAEVLAAAKDCGEDAWPLPMFEGYFELIKGDIADIKNVGGRWGGAITAAKFLERFVSGKPWVHLDIAGPAFASSNRPHREAGATGCFVRTLVELARRHSHGGAP